ncbi:unnamed protein product [Rotaria sp. Silwood2]|nr:unnamed protein product [Rotaria sp. Silwood2]CAF2855855.1 unnamed protein product [Rotaria sp. Silwood2]CAF3081045.1 unnamed protein product [Rotaria sp. Silwood2]CAF3382274.1 unnamed protein product [Rotaria sp. Silwood2]CAF4071460.1 unnamed protein product [Rotaria sp. Silwood2]
MDNIRVQFPELVNIDERIWNEVYQETHLYQHTAAYILLDLQESYRVCWRIQMTKRCAQMLLKYESTAVTQLYETGMLGEIEYSHILELIENKLFDLEFFRVKMPKGQPKAIENAFDLLVTFRSIPDQERVMWETILKSKQEWFQPGEILLEKGQTVSTAYLIARGIVQCQVDAMPIYYRSGNIVGIDALFSQNLTAHGTYSVSGGLLEAYRIDATLLNQLLTDENLAPLIYHEIALHILSNNYQTHLKLNRSEVKRLLRSRAKFYRKQSDLLIRLKKNERLFLLAGSVVSSSEGQNHLYDSIQFEAFDKPTMIHFNTSTVVYTWTNDDEINCSKTKNIKVHFPVQTFGSISNDLLYPGYSGTNTEFSGRKHLVESLRFAENFKDVQEMPSETKPSLEHKF